ncbi:MAG: hypothetical protein SV253_08655 [Halobacteria archaeon]|nr:hypothetical protein [Halobacteria archaeon]
MGRINVRVDDDLLEEVDSEGDVRSEVVRRALKSHLGVEEFSGSGSDSDAPSDTIEEVVEQKLEDEIYPRLGNIYDRLEDEEAKTADGKRMQVEFEIDPEVYDFYERYTQAFETPLSEIVSDVLEEEAVRLSDEIGEMSRKKPSWVLDDERQ